MNKKLNHFSISKLTESQLKIIRAYFTKQKIKKNNFFKLFDYTFSSSAFQVQKNITKDISSQNLSLQNQYKENNKFKQFFKDKIKRKSNQVLQNQAEYISFENNKLVNNKYTKNDEQSYDYNSHKRFYHQYRNDYRSYEKQNELYDWTKNQQMSNKANIIQIKQQSQSQVRFDINSLKNLHSNQEVQHQQQENNLKMNNSKFMIQKTQIKRQLKNFGKQNQTFEIQNKLQLSKPWQLQKYCQSIQISDKIKLNHHFKLEDYVQQAKVLPANLVGAQKEDLQLKMKVTGYLISYPNNWKRMCMQQGLFKNVKKRIHDIPRSIFRHALALLKLTMSQCQSELSFNQLFTRLDEERTILRLSTSKVEQNQYLIYLKRLMLVNYLSRMYKKFKLKSKHLQQIIELFIIATHEIKKKFDCEYRQQCFMNCENEYQNYYNNNTNQNQDFDYQSRKQKSFQEQN